MTAVAGTTELMNRAYRRQQHIYDLTRKYFLIGRDRLIERLGPAPSDRVLEIGCGTGRNLIVAARKYPHARFYGIDVSTEMLTTAIRAIDRAGLSSRVRVAHGDAGAFDPAMLFGIARFERVFFSYSLSMIVRWDDALNRTIALLPPGGELHTVDFGTLERLPPLLRTPLRSWLSLFHVTPVERLELWLTLRAGYLGAKVSAAHLHRSYTQYLRLAMPAA
jgi:S-adenosylmethionine-diacylgycerolhomoserine-N-methlytransferase